MVGKGLISGFESQVWPALVPLVASSHEPIVTFQFVMNSSVNQWSSAWLIEVL